jgi:hypothetical protein
MKINLPANTRYIGQPKKANTNLNSFEQLQALQAVGGNVDNIGEEKC